MTDQIKEIDLYNIINPVSGEKSIVPRDSFTLHNTGNTDHLLPKLGPVFPHITNKKTGKIMKAHLWGNGADYRYWNCTIDNKPYTFNCHTLVASAFIMNNDPKNKKVVLHLNNRKFDFRVSNLKWGTWYENNNFKKTGNQVKAREQIIINKGYTD